MRSDDGDGAPQPRKPLDPAADPAGAGLDESTGLPALRSWRGVYTVVLGLFVLWVGLLTWLTLAYS